MQDKKIKVCSKCKLPDGVVSFAKNKRKKDGLQTFCRECNKKASSIFYQKNKQNHYEYVKQKRIERSARNKQFILDYLSTHPCIDCGQNNLIVLEFDHVRGQKIKSIAEMVRDEFSIETIIDEIAKCEVRCANCHRIKTAKERNWSWLELKGP